MIDDKKYLENGDFGPRGYCHMKLRNPDGGWPLKYGIIRQSNPLVICLLDFESRSLSKTGDEIHFTSVDEMLAAGWLVD